MSAGKSRRVWFIFFVLADFRVTLQSRVARCYGWRSEAKTRRRHGLGGRTVRLES